ncbi:MULTISPECIES: hypothetical protein [Listeria]|uniref:hypothetical protein n=1 Tax=Listeria TaxID=1637 RepID=UPI000B5914D1|nr:MULTISPECIES: hypothetical protein [Listeria]
MKKAMYKIALALILITGILITITPDAMSKSVLSWQKYDINKYTKKRTVVSEQWKSVPNNVYWHSSNVNRAGSGWNYNRYVITLKYFDAKTKRYY